MRGALPGLARRVTTSPWRDALFAGAVLATGVALHLGGLYTLDPRVPAVPPWRLGLLGWACLVMLLRRRKPVVALLLATPAVIADLVAGLSLAMVLVIGDLLYCATRYGSRRASRVMVVLAAAAPAVTLVAALSMLPDWRTAVLLSVQVAALPVVPIFWAREVRQHREIADAERFRSAQVARIAELDRAAAIAQERARMARDLHDVVAGHVSAIALQSEAVLSMADRDPGTVRAVLGSVRENSVAALVEMRAMIELLRTGTSADPPLVPARLAELDRLVDSARAGGLRVTVRDERAAGRRASDGLPSVVDLTAYRIVQEALTNAMKHAEGAHARVSLRRAEDRLVVEVTNDIPAGSGAGEPGRAGTGLLSMGERAAAVGGTVRAGRAGDRWRVHAELPTGSGGPVDGGTV